MATIKDSTAKAKNIDILEETPNIETRKEIEGTRKGLGLYRVSNIDELFREIFD